MALVTFTDSSGRAWRAWDVERVRPRPGATEFLEASFRDGWVVFETEDGAERRRLGSYPADWAAMGPADLERLCAAAVPAARLGALDRAESHMHRGRDATAHSHRPA